MPVQRDEKGRYTEKTPTTTKKKNLQDLSNFKNRMLKNLFNGGYATTRIFLNPCPQFRIIKDEFSFKKIKEEKGIYEDDSQKENLESFSSYPCKKYKESLATSDDNQTLEPEIEEFLSCLSQDPLSIHECNEQSLEELYGMITKEIQGEKDHIKTWFQRVIRPPYHSIFRHFLASNLYEQLISHVQAFIKAYFSNLDMSLLIILLHKWVHWKFSYT